MGKRSSSRGYEPRIFAMHLAMDLREQINEAADMKFAKEQNKKKLSRSYWYGRLANAMAALKSIDPLGWEAWFDDDNNVPEPMTFRDHAMIIESRVSSLLNEQTYARPVARLYKNVFIWLDNECAFIICEKSKKLIEFKNLAEAQGYVDANNSIKSLTSGGQA